MSEQISLTAEELEAIDRIARTHDGRLLHRYLRRVLEACYDFSDTSALLTGNGRRTLARDLMGHMAEGIEGTRDGRDPARGDEPILRNAVGAAGRRGSRADQRRAIWAAERHTGDDAGANDGIDAA